MFSCFNCGCANNGGSSDGGGASGDGVSVGAPASVGASTTVVLINNGGSSEDDSAPGDDVAVGTPAGVGSTTTDLLDIVSRSIYKCQHFPYNEIEKATGAFARHVGEGGFGKVYKGTLQTGEEVAVKMYAQDAEGARQFESEIRMLSNLKHPNIIKLIGYSNGQHHVLVYEYMSNGALSSHIHDPAKDSMDWNTRMKIATGIARGLMYLHNEAQLTVVHKDIKSNNVLLGEDFSPKISDFGIGKIVPPEGSNEHIPSEVAKSKGIDTYRFGVILLQLISGMKEHLVNGLHIREWVIDMLHGDPSGCMTLVDERMPTSHTGSSVKNAVELALRCTMNWDSPHLSEVVEAMESLTSGCNEASSSSIEIDINKYIRVNRNEITLPGLFERWRHEGDADDDVPSWVNIFDDIC